MITKESPKITCIPMEEFFLPKISIVAPLAPSNKPIILKVVSLSPRMMEAKIVIRIGVVSISREAWIEEVIDSPLIKRSWLMVIPRSAHQTNLFQWALWILGFTGLNSQSSHNKIVVPNILAKLSPNACINPPLMSNLTTVKFMAKKMLVPSNARCGVSFGFRKKI